MRSNKPHLLSLPPPPELIDDAIAEILLRFPPDDPACLVRASVVCKLWHEILSNPTFPDRYREFHGTPPLLGFLCGSYAHGDDEPAGRFVPITPTRIPFRLPLFGCRPLDCRHGRVLLDAVTEDGTDTIKENRLAVWDPFTGDHKEVIGYPDPDPSGYSGAVLCAAAAGCGHHDCHSGPFQVVFVSTSHDDDSTTARAWVYSSETAAWSTPTSVEIEYAGYVMLWTKRAAIVGDYLYFLLSPGAGIIMYDLGKRCLTVVGSPSPYTYEQPGILMTTEDGLLGFIGVRDDYSTLHLWTTKVNPNGSMGWVQDRVISLNNLVPVIHTNEDTYNQGIEVVGFAEGMDILLLGAGRRGFMLELKSGRFRKLNKPDDYYYEYVFYPYLSFYIPDFASHK